MHPRFRVQAVAGLLFIFGATASAQIAPSELSAPGFFGPTAMSAVTQAIGSTVPLGDKTKPVTFNAQIGTIYEFLHKGNPVLVISGTKPIDFGAGVVLPKNTLVLNSWVAIFSRTDGTMAVSDFPDALGAQLAKFWPAKQLSLYGNGFAVRAEPTGDLLDDVRSFLSLDNLSGTTVVAFEKSSMRRTTSGRVTTWMRLMRR